MKLFSNLSQIFSLSWRVVVVALGYTVTLVLAGVILGVLGLLAAAPEATTNTTTIFLWTFVGSLIMGLTLGLVARQLPASAPRHLLVWGVLLISNISAVIIEGYFFVPELVTNLGATLIQQWLPCLVTAWLDLPAFRSRPGRKAGYSTSAALV